MVYYLIVCRSLTYAQRTAQALEQRGIRAHIQRTPKSIVREGCGYSVKIAEKNLRAALMALNKAGLSPMQVYITEGDGSYREVTL